MSCREHGDALVDLARGVLAPPGDDQVRAHLAQCDRCAARFRREQALTAGLQVLGGATRQGRPSDGMEARLLAEFGRIQAGQPEAPSARRRALPITRRFSVAARRPLVAAVSRRPWLAAAARRPWLAAAATVLLIVGGAVAWRSFSGARPADVVASRSAQLASVPAVVPELAAPVAFTAEPRSEVAMPGERSTTPRQPAQRPRAPEETRIEFVAWPGTAALPPFESGQLVRTELPAAIVPLLGLRDEVSPDRRSVEADVILGQDGLPRAVRLVR